MKCLFLALSWCTDHSSVQASLGERKLISRIEDSKIRMQEQKAQNANESSSKAEPSESEGVSDLAEMESFSRDSKRSDQQYLECWTTALRVSMFFMGSAVCNLCEESGSWCESPVRKYMHEPNEVIRTQKIERRPRSLLVMQWEDRMDRVPSSKRGDELEGTHILLRGCCMARIGRAPDKEGKRLLHKAPNLGGEIDRVQVGEVGAAGRILADAWHLEDFVSPDILAAVCAPVVFCAVAAFLASNELMQPSAHYAHYELTVDITHYPKKYFGAANQYYQYLSVLTPDEVLQWAMSRVWGCEVSQGVAQVSAERELSVKAARDCSEVGRGYMEPASWVVASDRKQSRTLQRSAKLRRSGRLGQERVGFELLRPRASAARWGMQGMNLTELPRPSEMRGVNSICRRATVVLSNIKLDFAKPDPA
ncbi:hypothetical protein EDB86DRAFT_3126730 [Lactarius hatsudake]|nr:hypothetical protein EDB86DRAFT_3126730 [Lactarius hatsudake]